MGDHPLPHGRLGRPSRVVPGLRFRAVHLPQLPQPALPEVPEHGHGRVGGGPPAKLLPVPYFHNVFTLPHELNALILYSERNQRALLELLFDAAAQTLLEFGRTELGGKVGFTLVLHTWDQQLRGHFHLHGLIASGALSADGSRWIAGGRQFLFPVCGLSKMFRASTWTAWPTAGRGRTGPAAAVGRTGRSGRAAAAGCGGSAEAVGGVLAGSVCRAAQAAGLPGTLHASGGDQQPPPPGLPGRASHVTISRPPRRRPAEDGRPSGRGIPAPLPAARLAGPLLPHPALRLAGQLREAAAVGALPAAAGRATAAGAPAPRTAAEWMRAELGIDVTRCPRCGAELRAERLWVVRKPGAVEYVPSPYPEFEVWNTS